MAFVNTDEIFALAMTEKEPISTTFMLGLGSLPVAGWTLGTLSGALAGSLLPQNIRTALGVMLYGMFIAIVVPPAKRDKSVLITAVLAMALSCLFAWTPVLNTVSPGVAIVVCTVAAAAFCAWKFPIKEEAE
jgi:predicted branched-subunit amino acid permease